MINKKTILGIGITDATKEEILEYITRSLEHHYKKYFIVTPNPEFLVLANKNHKFKNILNNADIALADGVGLMLAGKILGKPLKERLTGVELLESLCRAVAGKPITVGFLGGRENVAEKTAECLVARYPRLKVVFAESEWPKVNSGSGEVLSSRYKVSSIKENILNTKYIIHNTIDILFVAFGAPKQEIWISQNLDKLPVKVAIGVGGAFDYISGKIPRAPRWVQKLGFEWLYRLIRQPWRLKRQLRLLEFILLVLKERIVSKKAI